MSLNGLGGSGRSSLHPKLAERCHGVSSAWASCCQQKSSAIAKARSNPKYKQLFRSVRGIAFFATPHRGGLAAKHGAAAAGALRHATRNPRSSIMEALRADSLISFDIHQYFLHSLDNIRICSFYEMKSMSGLGSLVS